jgi:hypothetical protein
VRSVCTESFAHNEQPCTIFTQFAHFHTHTYTAWRQRKRTGAGRPLTRRLAPCIDCRVNYFAENALIIQRSANSPSRAHSCMLWRSIPPQPPPCTHVCMCLSIMQPLDAYSWCMQRPTAAWLRIGRPHSWDRLCFVIKRPEHTLTH